MLVQRHRALLRLLLRLLLQRAVLLLLWLQLHTVPTLPLCMPRQSLRLRQCLANKGNLRRVPLHEHRGSRQHKLGSRTLGTPPVTQICLTA